MTPSTLSIRSIESELNQLIDFLRSKGVLQFSGYGVTLALLPEAPATEATAAEEAPKQEAKRGRDGLTAEEQTELYGRALSDTRM